MLTRNWSAKTSPSKRRPRRSRQKFRIPFNIPAFQHVFPPPPPPPRAPYFPSLLFWEAKIPHPHGEPFPWPRQHLQAPTENAERFQAVLELEVWQQKRHAKNAPWPMDLGSTLCHWAARLFFLELFPPPSCVFLVSVEPLLLLLRRDMVMTMTMTLQIDVFFSKDTCGSIKK